MNKIFCAIAAGAVTLAMPAAAADYPVKAATPTPIFTWTGTYIGVHGGYAWGEAPVPSGIVTRRGAFGGFQAGANYQTPNNWVIGLEQDVSIGGSRGDLLPAFPAPLVTFHTNYFGTFRGRVGYAWDRVLIYQTAGIAWAHHKAELDFLTAARQAAAGADALTYSQTQFHVGVAVGGGVEVAVTRNVTVKAEYLYVDLQAKRYFAGTTEADTAGWHDHTARIGVNWLLR